MTQPEDADHYDILGIDRAASQDEVRAAYLRLVRQWHPDVNSSPEAGARTKKINEAYAILGNQESREQYDRQTHNFRPGSSAGSAEQAARERAARERAAQERAAQERAAQERAAREQAAREWEHLWTRLLQTRLLVTVRSMTASARDTFSIRRLQRSVRLVMRLLGALILLFHPLVLCVFLLGPLGIYAVLDGYEAAGFTTLACSAIAFLFLIRASRD